MARSRPPPGVVEHRQVRVALDLGEVRQLERGAGEAGPPDEGLVDVDPAVPQRLHDVREVPTTVRTPNSGCPRRTP